jgi:hypothetical protein
MDHIYTSRAACMCIGVEGAWETGTGNCVDVDRDGAGMEHGATRNTKWAQDTKRRGTPKWSGRPDTSPRPDVRALAFP